MHHWEAGSSGGRQRAARQLPTCRASTHTLLRALLSLLHGAATASRLRALSHGDSPLQGGKLAPQYDKTARKEDRSLDFQKGWARSLHCRHVVVLLGRPSRLLAAFMPCRAAGQACVQNPPGRPSWCVHDCEQDTRPVAVVVLARGRRPDYRACHHPALPPSLTYLSWEAPDAKTSRE